MTPKYNIIISEGCTAFYTDVNGKTVGGSYEPTRLTDEEENELVDYLLIKVKEGIANGTIDLNGLIGLFQYDDYETDDTSCETCGDSVSRTIYNI
jgi:hypothetical protein